MSHDFNAAQMKSEKSAIDAALAAIPSIEQALGKFSKLECDHL